MFFSYFKIIVKILRKNDFKSILMLSGGTIVSQIIAFIAQPIATRIYSPEDFGVMAMVLAVFTMFSPIMNGHYNLSIVTSKEDDEAYILTKLSLYIGFFLTLIIFAGLFIYNMFFPSTFQAAGFWIYSSILLLFFSSITNVVYSFNNRFKQYKILATVSIYRALSSNIVKIGLGIANFGYIGLIVSNLFSVIVGIKKQSELLWKYKNKIFSSTKEEVFHVLAKHKKQPLFSMPGLFAVSISFGIIPIFITSLYGTKELGFYALAQATIGLLITLVSTNISAVFFQKASKEMADFGTFNTSLKSSLTLLIMISIIPILVLLMYSESLFTFVFGDIWIRSGTFIVYLIPWQFMNLISGSLVNSLLISGHQIVKSIIQFFFLIGVIIIYYYSKTANLDIHEFLIILSSSFAINYLVLLFIIIKVSRKKLIINN